MAQRVFLGFGAVVLAAYGVAFLVSPGLLGRLVGLAFEGPNAFVEIRAFYGGLELGLAAFLAWGAVRPEAERVALALFGFAFGAAGVARLWGIAEFGFTGPSQPGVAAVELAAATAAAWLARGARAPAA